MQSVTMISQKQTSLFTEEQLTLLQEASIASHIHPQENASAKKIRDISGRKFLDAFERFPRVGLWAKTFAGLLIGMEGWYSMKCRMTWKLSATKSSRFYFQLVPSTIRTEGIESGLLPTPQAMDMMTNPTRKITESGRIISNQGHNGSAPLKDLAMNGMLPTPRARAAGGNCSNNRNKGNLEDAIAEHTQTTGKTSQLSPLFVMEMMGFPTDWTLLPFLNGETNQSKQEATQ